MDERPVASGIVKHTISLTLTVTAIALAGLALVAWRDVLLLLFAGLVLATALQPLCDLVSNRFKIREWPAIAIVYSAASALLIGLAIWLVPKLWVQALALMEQLPAWYADARLWLLNSSSRTLHRLGSWTPESLPTLTMASLETAEMGAFGLTRRVLLAAGAILSIGVLAFYWAINREVTLRSLLQLVPEHRRPFYSELSETLLEKLGAYVRGQLILCGIVGVLSLIVYWTIGLPYALILALVAGILEAIPVFGPTLGAVPAILVALTVSPQLTLMVIVGAMLIQTLENYLFVPKVMDRSVGISAVVTLLALVAFGALFGLLGAILAIPLAAIVQTLFERLFLQADFKEKDVEISRDFAGVMRYQLLDLIHDVQRQQRTKDADLEESTTSAYNEIEALAVSLDDLIVRESSGEAEPAERLVQAKSA